MRPWWTEEEREANRELTLRKKILKVRGQTTNASGIQKGLQAVEGLLQLRPPTPSLQLLPAS